MTFERVSMDALPKVCALYEAAVAEFDSVCHYYTWERVDDVRRDVSVNECYGRSTFGPSLEHKAINADV